MVNQIRKVTHIQPTVATITRCCSSPSWPGNPGPILMCGTMQIRRWTPRYLRQARVRMSLSVVSITLVLLLLLSSAAALNPKALFEQYRNDNWAPSTRKKRSKRSEFEKFCATQEGQRLAGITALDPAAAAQNVRDSVQLGACKETLAVFNEFGCLGDTTRGA